LLSNSFFCLLFITTSYCLCRGNQYGNRLKYSPDDMLASNIRHPKEVTVRVYKAENVRVAPRSDHKQKKVSQKWKCVILGGKKNISSESVYAPNGNPVWNFETTFKIANRGDPVVILVSDSEDNHAGQVVVPGVTIPPRPTDPSVVLTDNSRLCVVELEQTKKTEIGFGRLYFWIWVEEYRKEESKTRGTKGSILSLHHHKDKGSIPNSLNYSGSVISLSSNNDEYKKKKKWYKKSENHTLHVPGVIPHSRSPLNSVSNIKSLDNGYNPFDYYHQQLNEDDGVIEEKDGSVLGAYSELTAYSLSSSSAFVANQLKRRNSMHSRNGLVSSDVDVSREDSSEQLKAKPELMRIAPKCGPSSGGTELTIYCRFLTTKIMEEASVFVGDHSVSRQDWFLNESSQNDLSQLRIHMPALPPGRYPLYIDSAEFGCVRCNQEFTYLQSNENSSQPPASNLAGKYISDRK
ncbi:Immunoglobulin E set, partial [Schistosoma japonicum]